MNEDSKFEYSGVIAFVLRNGRSAIVKLDQKTHDREYAVVSDRTLGRIALMNGKGRLPEGVKVMGEAVDGAEALRAVSVSRVEVGEKVA